MRKISLLIHWTKVRKYSEPANLVCGIFVSKHQVIRMRTNKCKIFERHKPRVHKDDSCLHHPSKYKHLWFKLLIMVRTTNPRKSSYNRKHNESAPTFCDTACERSERWVISSKSNLGAFLTYLYMGM